MFFLSHENRSKVTKKNGNNERNGEKFENSIGMTIFLPNSLQLSKKLRIIAPASNGSRSMCYGTLPRGENQFSPLL